MHEYDDYFDSPWPPDVGLIRALLDDVCTDAHGDWEQTAAIQNAFEDWADLPVQATFAGTSVTFESVQDRGANLVAQVTLQARDCVPVSLEDVRPVDGMPAAFLVAAWRLWRGLDPILPLAPPSDAERDEREVAPAPAWDKAAEGLRSLPHARLVALIGELYSASQSNRSLVYAKLGSLAASTDQARLSECKEKLSAFVAPHHDDPFQLGGALEVIDHYETATSDRAGTIELLIHCLECGSLAIEAYGDLFSEFYDTMIEVAQRCSDELAAEVGSHEPLLPRIEAILAAASRTGWGYEDALHGAFEQLDWETDE